jgi:hypothetical protein
MRFSRTGIKRLTTAKQVPSSKHPRGDSKGDVEMLKKLAILAAVVGGFAIADMPKAEAWPYRRIAPVRRILAPPYPVARAAVGPRYYARPYYGRGYYSRPYATGYRGIGYGPGLSGGVYFGF